MISLKMFAYCDRRFNKNYIAEEILGPRLLRGTQRKRKRIEGRKFRKSVYRTPVQRKSLVTLRENLMIKIMKGGFVSS